MKKTLVVVKDRLLESESASDAGRGRQESECNSISIPDSIPDSIPEQSFLIYDAHLKVASREFARWSKRFPYRYEVSSGENLKDLDAFPQHVHRMSQIANPLSPRSMSVVAVGGGSVGDFAGFFASVYKRGVRLVHVPSTWLAAIDSAHGGKTALNMARAKNQIGTIYPADQVVLVRSLLATQPEERVLDAMAELGKIALIDGGSWVRRLEHTQLRGADLLWAFLTPAIASKMRVVRRDPYETNGVRQILNLGHTVGHVFEAALALSHGAAVAQGLFFALEFSEHRGALKAAEFDRAMRLLSEKLGLYPQIPARGISERVFCEFLSRDKKKSSKDQINFIFMKAFGSVFREPISEREILTEARRQGWVSRRKK